jgi:hypothetical protein
VLLHPFQKTSHAGPMGIRELCVASLAG